jgi:hypothetical protein
MDTMTINRRLLHWGLFFVTTGAVVLAITGGLVTADGGATAFRLWPVLVIALGVGVLLRRTRLSAAGGIVLAVVPGLVLGGLLGAASLVWLPDWDELRQACVDARPAGLETRQGTFTGDASVDLELAVGDLTVEIEPGDGWRLQLADGPGRGPDVEADVDALSVESSSDQGWRWFDCGGDDWRLALPVAHRLDLAAEIDAAKGTFDLAGATVGDLRLVVNAGEARVDLAGATVEDLSLRVNGGAISLSLPATGELAGDISVNAGAVRVCAPDGLGLRVRSESTLASITTPRLVRVGDAWETLDYATAINHADVTVAVNVGSVEINPEGGCK